MAPELCDSADFLSTFRDGRRGHSWKENSPERSQSHLQKWLRGDWNLESSRVPPPTTQDPWGASRAGAWGQQQRCWFNRSPSRGPASTCSTAGG